jgi:hypothetical protein
VSEAMAGAGDGWGWLGVGGGKHGILMGNRNDF